MSEEPKPHSACPYCGKEIWPYCGTHQAANDCIYNTGAAFFSDYCRYCRARGPDVCKDSFQAGQCERRIGPKTPPTGGSAAKPVKTNPKDEFFLAAADLCRSLKAFVDLEIEFVRKEKR